MIHRFAHFVVLSGKVDQAIEIIKEFTQQVNEKEEDCILYRSLQHTEIEEDFTHYMIFKNKEAEEHHRQTPYVKKFVDELYPLLEIEPVFNSYGVVAD